MIDKAITEFENQENDPLHRLNALYVIVQQFKPKYFPLLQDFLQDNSEHPDIRSGVALALGKIGGQEAFDILKNYADDSNITVKNHVIQALGMTGVEDAMPLLVEALSDKNNHVFASATDGLGHFGDLAIPTLMDLLQASEDDIRCIAAWRLGELQAFEAVDPLLELLKSESSPDVISLCVWALGEIGKYDEAVIEELQNVQVNNDPDIQRRAVSAIRKIARHVN